MEIVAVIAAAEFPAALLVIVERHDLGIEPCAGRQIDKLGLVAVVDVALDRDLMAARHDIAVGSPARYRDGGERAAHPPIVPRQPRRAAALGRSPPSSRAGCRRRSAEIRACADRWSSPVSPSLGARALSTTARPPSASRRRKTSFAR